MATSIWPWRRTMRERGPLTGLTEYLRIEKRGITYSEYRMPISGRVRDVLRMPSSTHTRSTETSLRAAASYSRTNRKSIRRLVLGGWLFVLLSCMFLAVVESAEFGDVACY